MVLRYGLIRECWSFQPTDRPDFSNIVIRLKNMIETHADYLVMETDTLKDLVNNPSYGRELNVVTNQGGE